MKVYVVHTVSTPIGEGVVWAVCKTKAKAEEIAKECECADVEEFYLSGGEESNANILIEKLSECSKNLSEVNAQIQTLYNVIKEIKDPKSRQGLIYVYKQTYDALGKHVKSFNNLIRVVEEQATDVQPHNKKELGYYQQAKLMKGEDKMRDKMFQAISDIIVKHHNPDYDCAEIMALEDEYNATIYTLDASDLRLATDEIIDLIADFFIKGKELEKKKMSGGYFNYSNDGAATDIFGYGVTISYGLDELQSDANEVWENDPLEDREISELVYDVFCLLHSYDWYKEADTSEDTYRKDVKYFKDKWLNKSQDERIDSLIEKAIGRITKVSEEEIKRIKEIKNEN